MDFSGNPKRATTKIFHDTERIFPTTLQHEPTTAPKNDATNTITFQNFTTSIGYFNMSRERKLTSKAEAQAAEKAQKKKKMITVSADSKAAADRAAVEAAAAIASAAPRHPANLEEKKRGRSQGSQTFNNDDVRELLTLIEDALPLGKDAWTNEVVNPYNEYARENSRVQRTYESLREKFNKLLRSSKPTGDPNCPWDVKMAKRLDRAIQNKCEVAGEDSDQREDNDLVLEYHLSSPSHDQPSSDDNSSSDAAPRTESPRSSCLAETPQSTTPVPTTPLGVPGQMTPSPASESSASSSSVTPDQNAKSVTKRKRTRAKREKSRYSCNKFKAVITDDEEG
jgi:hypothetical protein